MIVCCPVLNCEAAGKQKMDGKCQEVVDLGKGIPWVLLTLYVTPIALFPGTNKVVKPALTLSSGLLKWLKSFASCTVGASAPFTPWTVDIW